MASVGPWTSAPSRPDLRSAKRRRVLQQAKIVTGAETMIHCEIRDISTGGARIALRRNVALPETFQLYIAAHTLQVHSANVRWRNGDFIGVAFEAAGGAGAAADGRARQPEPSPQPLLLSGPALAAAPEARQKETLRTEEAVQAHPRRDLASGRDVRASVQVGRYGHQRRRLAVR
ncbi:PilZ domain-containing protein [Microvirga thermotolerans]|uniref:PilZ domain-containing protein n=1 Tax=Microvirga thermotolerans TaxID=2651334 RepID=UPI001AEF127A|nr:PilZ domain-containing protein [Microvirga thermotolerans]